MIVRIVKMQFKPEEIQNFVEHFESIREKVRFQPGCHKVKLLQDFNNPGVFFTYSHWESEEDLNNYRNTEFFKEVWLATKKMFDAKPEAWSVHEILDM